MLSRNPVRTSGSALTNHSGVEERLLTRGQPGELVTTTKARTMKTIVEARLWSVERRARDLRTRSRSSCRSLLTEPVELSLTPARSTSEPTDFNLSHLKPLTGSLTSARARPRPR